MVSTEHSAPWGQTVANLFDAREWLERANALLHRTQCDPDPVTSVTYAMARLRHYGLEGEVLRREAMVSA
jgi:hypothetical protein